MAATAYSLTKPSSALKLSCTAHGPRPLPRSAPFTSQLLLSTNVKFAPFASRQRRGYVRDASERDLAVHLETALRGIIISERWPKSGLDIVVTVLEGDEENHIDKEVVSGIGEHRRSEGWGTMSTLSSCITVASAAIADAGIDCIDLVTGGVAAIVRQPRTGLTKQQSKHRTTSALPGDSRIIIQDPCPAENEEILATCVVGYLPSRDEITEIWVKGDVTNPFDHSEGHSTNLDALMDQAVDAAMATRLVLLEAVKESTEIKMQKNKLNT